MPPTSRSTTSSSTSKPRKPDSYRRSRLFKRGCAHERLTQAHFPYLWAAYKRGALSHLPDFPENMTAEAFGTRMSEEIVALIQTQGDAEVLIAKTRHGSIPIGLATIHYAARHIEPEWLWFSEASLRNKLECAAKFLVALKSQVGIVIAAKPENVTFYGHLCKYGILRRVGIFHDYWPSENAVLYQSVSA